MGTGVPLFMEQSTVWVVVGAEDGQAKAQSQLCSPIQKKARKVTENYQESEELEGSHGNLWES